MESECEQHSCDANDHRFPGLERRESCPGRQLESSGPDFCQTLKYQNYETKKFKARIVQNFLFHTVLPARFTYGRKC